MIFPRKPHFDNGPSVAGRYNRYQVTAAEGVFGLDFATKYEGQRIFATDEPAPKTVVQPANMFAAMPDPFAECIVTGSAPRSSGREGLQEVHIMSKIYEAARTGRTVEIGPTPH